MLGWIVFVNEFIAPLRLYNDSLEVIFIYGSCLANLNNRQADYE